MRAGGKGGATTRRDPPEAHITTGGRATRSVLDWRVVHGRSRDAGHRITLSRQQKSRSDEEYGTAECPSVERTDSVTNRSYHTSVIGGGTARIVPTGGTVKPESEIEKAASPDGMKAAFLHRTLTKPEASNSLGAVKNQE
jgi:hypothetical protein